MINGMFNGNENFFDNIKEITYDDGFEIEYENGEFEIYCVVDSREYGRCLQTEGGPLIKEIRFFGNYLLLFDVEGHNTLSSSKVKSIVVNDSRLKRRFGIGIEGVLLMYDVGTAIKYSLDLQKALGVPTMDEVNYFYPEEFNNDKVSRRRTN